ncbi:MAG: hypothetical protein K6C08_01295 [Oscillospiraceae bacterium]|nr:hypothetical protein [Oscillospiraceae bacterium]
MKKAISGILAIILALTLCAGGSSVLAAGQKANGTPIPGDQAAVSDEAEDAIADSAWEELESLGRIETENGLLYVFITLPAELVGSDSTQKSIDANAGETYTSGKLNEDGSVTYKMTRKQHKEMLESVAESIEEAMEELVESPDYAFTRISHSDDFTVFDVYLSTEEIGFAESFMVLGFYMYGGMYGLLLGHEADNIAVNYYSPGGNLIETANSSEMGD